MDLKSSEAGEITRKREKGVESREDVDVLGSWKGIGEVFMNLRKEGMKNILVIICCVTNYHKLGNLKQHTFIFIVSVDQESGHGLVGPLF